MAHKKKNDGKATKIWTEDDRRRYCNGDGTGM